MNVNTQTLHATHHQTSSKDQEWVAAMREQVAPFKGLMRSPEARPSYDEMIGAIPDAGDVSYEKSTLGGISGIWCRPKNARTGAAILYLHGGAYILGSADAYRHFVGQMASAFATDAFVADYRLGPEHPFPAAIEDAQAAYRGLVEQGVKHIVVMGDSAGGGLSLVLLSQAQAEADAGKGLAPSAGIVVSPWTDLALTGASVKTKADEDPFVTQEMLAACAGLYLGTQDPTEPLASPLYGKLKGLPPIQLHVGTSEVLLDDSLRYAEKAVAAGVDASVHIWEKMPHVFTSHMGTLDAAEQALSLMVTFVKDTLSANQRKAD
jgi:monoterpene epsilon-lactone hydrolase